MREEYASQKGVCADDDREVVYSAWITRNGKRIYPPKGRRAWRFEVRKTSRA